MGAIRTSANATVRDSVVAGLPASGANKPAKADFRATFGVVEDEIAAVGAAALSNLIVEKTWTALAARSTVGLESGAGAEITADAGTHTDPVVGGPPVSNTGRFRYSTSPAGWERVGAPAGYDNRVAAEAAEDATAALLASSETTLDLALDSGLALEAILQESDTPGVTVAGVNTEAPPLLRAKDVSGEQHIFTITGTGEADVSDGEGNDIAPLVVGDAVHFASDRQDGSTYKRFRGLIKSGPALKSITLDHSTGEIIAVLVLGQSPGTRMGSLALATQSDALHGQALMFNGSAQPIDSPVRTSQVADADIDHFIPLASVGGMMFAEATAKRLATAGTIALPASAAVGGQAYEYLRRGSFAYSNMLEMAMAIAREARLLKLGVRFVVCFQQGEAEYGISYADRRAQLAQLVTHVNEDLCHISGQSAVHVFAGQCPSISQAEQNFALADEADDNALLHNIGPLYQLTFMDSQHPDENGLYRLGEMYYRAIWAVRNGGAWNGTWTPFSIASATYSAGTVTVTTQGDTGNPQINTTLVSAITGNGFELFDGADAVVTFSGVSATGTGYLITGCGSTPVTLRTAWTAPAAVSSPEGSVLGARTNLCDQDTLTSDIAALSLPNWMISQEIAIT